MSEGDPLIGSEIAGRYVIDARVGEGSMGLIYRAHHVRLPRPFAVKILFGDLVNDQLMRLRFAQEAALASQLSHPNVVSVVDFGRSERGLLYLVMDFVQGETLSELIVREAPLDPLRAIRLTRQLAQGLGHAHEHGLVHRDFKPGNVILERREEGPPLPRILDFGLAISTSETEELLPGRLTECGYIVGTPIYIAPEQALDHPVDGRADLFALGVVLYEMLAGKPPFDGRPIEIAHKNVSQVVPRIADRSPGVSVPAELERLVRRLLEKSPEKRFGSAEELCAALDAVEQSAGEMGTMGMEAMEEPELPSIWNDLEDLESPTIQDDIPDYREVLDSESAAEAHAHARARRRVSVLGALLFAAGAIAYAMADRVGLTGVTRLEPPVPPAAAAKVEAGPPDPVPEPEVFPAGGTSPAAVLAPAAPASAWPESSLNRPVRAKETRSVLPVHRHARPADDATAPDGALPETAQAAMPVGRSSIPGAGADRSLMVEALAARSAPAAVPAARAEPDRAQDPSVSHLIKEYREVGEAIARLQSTQGEQTARPFRVRYFRLPYGDAIRILAVRRDVLEELARLRQAVMSTLQPPAPPRTAERAALSAG